MAQHFRVMLWKRTAEDSEKVKDFVAGYPRYALFSHTKRSDPEEHPHYHFYIQSEATMATFRARLKKAFTRDKHEYSVQTCDPDRVDEYLQYMWNLKNDNMPECLAHNFEQSRIDDAESRSKAATELFVDKRKKAKTDAVTAITIVNEVVKWYEKRTIESRTHHNWGELPQEEILALINEVIDAHNRHDKTYCEYSLCKVYDSVLGRLKGHARSDLQHRVLARVTPKSFS